MAAHWGQPPRGYKGISVVGNPTIIGVMLMCANIWNSDANCAYNKTHRNFWVKAAILSPDI